MPLSAQDQSFVAHCMELLAPLGAVRAKRMFGGHGLYIDELFVAVIAYQRLYLKAQDSTRQAFADAGCQPFVFSSQGNQVTMGYWSAPEEAMDSPAAMLAWGRLAMAAALAARTAKPPSKRAPKPHARSARAARAKAPKPPKPPKR